MPEATDLDVFPGVAAEMRVDEVESVVDLIVAEQTTPQGNVPSVGIERVGVIAELSEFEPAWTETVRVVRGSDDCPTGVILADWNVVQGKAWIHGPWIRTRSSRRWQAIADVLLGAVTEQIPSKISSFVLSSTVDHTRIAELAIRRGWPGPDIDHVLLVGAAVVAAWPASETSMPMRDMTEVDLAAVAKLHDAAFPSTYFSAAQLLDRSLRGEHVVLVSGAESGHVDGYVAGQVQVDGDGYIDFLAVAPDVRRRGLGRALTVAAVRRLLPETLTRRVCLTVQDQRAPARALYESLGFSAETTLASYGSELRHPEAGVDLGE